MCVCVYWWVLLPGRSFYRDSQAVKCPQQYRWRRRWRPKARPQSSLFSCRSSAFSFTFFTLSCPPHSFSLYHCLSPSFALWCCMPCIVFDSSVSVQKHVKWFWVQFHFLYMPPSFRPCFVLEFCCSALCSEPGLPRWPVPSTSWYWLRPFMEGWIIMYSTTVSLKPFTAQYRSGALTSSCQF